MYSPTAHWWQYPLARPSFRFRDLNNAVRQIDQRYEALPAADQDDWDDAAETWPWWARCVPWVYDYDPTRRDGVTGKDAYTGVNAANLVNGLAVSDTVPASATLPAGDTLTLDVVSVFQAIWAGRSVAPVGSFMAHVRACALNHEPERGPAISKYSWGFAAPIVYDTPLDLSPLSDTLGGILQMPYVAIAISVMDLGSNAFFGGRVGAAGPL